MTSRTARAIALAAALAACDQPPAASGFQGYVEGDYLLIGPAAGGRIDEVAVRAGDRVEAGTVLVRLDQEEAVARRDQARATLALARTELADLRQGQRPEEIAVIEAQIAEVEASLATAEREFERLERLKEQRVISESALDQARMARDTAKARRRALESQLAVARLPARKDAIAAAEHRIDIARAALAEAEKQLADRRIESPQTGLVQDVYFRPGEVVNPGGPLLALLPPANRKIRFFVPEASLASLRLGQRVEIGCDGCPADLQGRIAFISTEAEYTPPVIFSVESRAKLVFKVEAEPLGEAVNLRVGQPVDVRLGGMGR